MIHLQQHFWFDSTFFPTPKVVCVFFIDVFYLRLDVFLAISILSRSDVGRNFEVVV